MNVPLVLFIFKRHDTVLRILDVVRQVKPNDIYLIADGPRTSVSGEAELCLTTRLLIENAIDWDCNIHKKYSDKNLGGPTSMMNGIRWVFDSTDKAIFLEDDDLPSKSFLNFCADMLLRYSEEEDVFLVTSGDKNLGVAKDVSNSYYFDKHVLSILGFGMWRRVWEKFDSSLAGWESEKERIEIENRFQSKGRFKNLSSYWNQLISGERQSWDFTLLYNFYATKGSIVIVPNKNLVENIGIRPDATRTQISNPFVSNPVAEELDWPLKHPIKIKAIEGSDIYLHKRKHGLMANLGKIIIRIRKIFAFK